MEDFKITTTYGMTFLKIKGDHSICFLHNPHVSIIKKPWAAMNCKVNYLQYTYVAFSICLAIYSLLFVDLMPFVVGLPFSMVILSLL